MLTIAEMNEWASFKARFMPLYFIKSSYRYMHIFSVFADFQLFSEFQICRWHINQKPKEKSYDNMFKKLFQKYLCMLFITPYRKRSTERRKNNQLTVNVKHILL